MGNKKLDKKIEKCEKRCALDNQCNFGDFFIRRTYCEGEFNRCMIYREFVDEFIPKYLGVK